MEKASDFCDFLAKNCAACYNKNMDKLVLIDGNSLLNRAFYAMSVFTTKDGLPTNGIFGFVKLLLKIIDDENPKYIAVAFDLHAPTFRHKLYPDYKGTRKPMPEELVVQVPVLKDLLRAMDICIVEKEGYEADDLIGTLSKKFEGVDSLIYTGDRDSYQLIGEHVSVCFTKRGVSDLIRLTKDNFTEHEGIEPWQVIELKALMGDSSDNIPGVKGIGPKSALSLLQSYRDLDGVYAHLDECSASLKTKLTEHEAEARLSKTLATIDTHVPLDISLENCMLRIPFPEEARRSFAKLEFRSLVGSEYFPKEQAYELTCHTCTSDEFNDRVKDAEACTEFSLCVESDGLHLAIDGKEYLFPLRTNFLEPGFFLEELKPLLTALFQRDKLAVLADYKAIAHLLDGAGIAMSCRVEDVTLLRYLIDSNLRPSGAKAFAQDYSMPEDCCACALARAYRDALEQTRGTAEEKLYRELELPLSQVLFEMERTGVRVDINKFSAFSEKFKGAMAELSARIFEIAGVAPFNLNSPFQLSEVLFEKLGYSAKGVKKNIRGGYSTSAEVLEKLAEDHEIARLILQYREVQKLQSTYVDGIRPLVKNGIVHTTYNQTMTTTGRLSSANPNLQNIPVRTEMGRELRKLFIAREGNILIDADYSQIELRLLAHFSGCKALREAYGAGEDIHAATAARLFHTPLAEVTPSMRRRAKTINFGIIYGMSAFGMAKDLGCPPDEAQRYIDAYFAAHPEVKIYMEENVRRAKEDGFVTTVLGRKRFIPELKSGNYNQRMFGERAAMNMPLQGSAADIIKIAMLRVHDRLKKDGSRAQLVLQVHDELVLDAPEGEAEYAKKMLKEEMEAAIRLDVPLIADVSVGKSWYDAK